MDRLDPRLAATPVSPPSKPRLTPREREVVTLLARGLTGEEIAETLSLSSETVRTHLRNAMKAMGARTRAHLIALALTSEAIALD